MAPEEHFASMNPDDMGEGGGLLNDINLTWKETRFVLYDYNGTVPVKNPALRVLLVDEDGAEFEQYWSAGDAKNWVPSSDGKRLQSVESTTSEVNRTTNTGILMKSLVDSGYDRAALATGDVSTLDGMVAHMIQVPAPKRDGVTASAAPRADGRVFEKTILVVDQIPQMPGEKKAAPKGRTRSAPAAQTKSATPANDPTSDDVVTTKARESINAVLEENIGEHPEGIPKAELVKLVFNHLRQDPDRNTIVQQSVSDDEFLMDGSQGLWVYEDGTVSLP